MQVKIYLHEVYIDRNRIDTSYVLVSKEFGWMEFYEEDEKPTFIWKNKKDMIESSYNPRKKEWETFEKYGNLTLLGYL